ncbi:response regulator transcription factor [Collinsella sp. AGMB00827]|uniref:Response regulator transcription factor n=1 Tax=Collinsella ureilytica TaxID=2869515 RepID=A0ABS7MKG7_9ACTN|nr:response regulator transcription factor [Collinsella urealyticum]MBY4797528.1 response regulator transcription factor [Collinsella urealyticum]
MSEPLIYIVEDDAAIRNELIAALERNGFKTAAAISFDRVVEEILAAEPDLVLLDLSLPGTDGQFICRELRGSSDVPIVVLTARTTEIDEVMSMNLGADDFIPKPYRLRVLVARIEALLRRASGAEGALVLSHGGVELDPARSLARAHGKQIELTKNEMRILALLISKAGTIVSREAIMRDLWDSEAFVDDNTLTVNINRLRSTLEKIGVTDYLVTHRGHGYSV